MKICVLLFLINSLINFLDFESPDIYESIENVHSTSPIFKNDPILFIDKSITPGLNLTLTEMGSRQLVANDLPKVNF